MKRERQTVDCRLILLVAPRVHVQVSFVANILSQKSSPIVTDLQRPVKRRVRRPAYVGPANK